MIASRTFRVFVSSTFADLVEERNALQRRVWPELAKLCEKAGFRFQAIDLRWGVPSEAALDQRTSRICLDELKRCQDTSPRPNFIILLGNRYGWRPLPEEIEAKEFEAIAANAQSLKLDESLLREWYRLDMNAFPAVYYLRPRRQNTDEADGKWWTDNVEQPLRNLFLQCIDALWAKDDPRRAVYERSLTEREIMAGALNPAASDARDHVFAYFRGVDYLDSVTHVDEAEATHLRPFVDFVANTTECDTTARQLHRNLKKILEAALGHQHVRKFDATWTGTLVSQDHLDRLCDAVLNDLRGVIEAEIKKFEEKPPLEVEISAHEEFAKLRGGADDDGQSRFQGRAETLNVIAEYLSTSDKNRPLVIYGPAGSGKSALMAKAALDADESLPNAVRLRRFIGATPPSVDARSLLQGLCEELGQKFQNTAEVPLEYRELVSAFRERLGWATADRPVVVFLDAVDQLSESDNARSLVWLPRQLPPHVRLIVSVLNDPLSSEAAPGTKSPTNSDPFETLKRRDKSGELLHQIGDYPEHDAKALLSHWLRSDKRTLTDGQETLVLNAFAKCPRPLFLKLASEEAKQWRSDTTTVKMPNAATSVEMLSAIINQLFDRLSEPSNHGERLVERAIGYLVASKNGLTEDELLGLLSTDKEFFDEFVDRAKKVNQPLPSGVDSLPVAVWVRLYSDLQPYLTTRRADGTTLLAFYHRSLERVARQRFLSTEEIAGQRHKHIADYFTPKSKDANGEMKFDPLGFFRLTLEEQRAWTKTLPPKPRPVNIRMVMELPHQLLEVAKLLGNDDAPSMCWDAVADVLLNIHYLEAAGESLRIYSFLLLSGHLLRQRSRLQCGTTLAHISATLRRYESFLIEHPTSLFQCLWNSIYCWNSDPLMQLMRTSRIKCNCTPWGEALNTPRLPPSSYVEREIRAHAGAIRHLSWSPNGMHLASSDFDGVLKVHDVATNTSSQATTKPIAILALKWKSADSLLVVSKDGRVLTYSTTLKLVSETRLFRGETEGIAADISVCCRHVAVATKPFALYVHRLPTENDKQKRIFYRRIATTTIHSVRWCPRNESLLALSCGTFVLVYDALAGQLTKRFSSQSLQMDPHEWNFEKFGSMYPLWEPGHIAWSPTDPLISVVFCDCTPAIINTDTWTYLYSATGPDHGVTGFEWSPDGTYIGSVSRFELLLVSNIHTREDEFGLETIHSGAPTCIAWSHRFLTLATGGEDGVIFILSLSSDDNDLDEEAFESPRGVSDAKVCKYSHSGAYFGYVADYFDTVVVENMQDHRRTRLICHGDLVLTSDAFHFSPDDKMASVVKSNVAWLFQLDCPYSFMLEPAGQIRGHGEVGVYACRWSPNNESLLTIECDQIVRLWNAKDCRFVSEVGYGKEFDTLKWARAGNRFISGSNWELSLYSAQDHEVLPLADLPLDIDTFSVSPDGSRCIGMTWNNEWRLYETDGGHVIESFRGVDWVERSFWSADSKVVILFGHCGTVVFVEVDTGLELFRSDGNEHVDVRRWVQRVSHMSSVGDGRFLCFYGPFIQTRIFDLWQFKWVSIDVVLRVYPGAKLAAGYFVSQSSKYLTVCDGRGRCVCVMPFRAKSVTAHCDGSEWAVIENGMLNRFRVAQIEVIESGLTEYESR